eukprot:m.245811 g.245811  ORF g.245811 m.245811 type:complete len:241 (+) comp33840_c9_seq3:270-992(+)
MANFALLQEQMKVTRKIDLEFGIGERVECKGYDCQGTVRYYGPHQSKKRRIVYGIELDEPLGDNNGTVYEKKYFTCDTNHGVLLPAPSVARATGKKKKRKSKKKKEAKQKTTVQATEEDFGDGGFGEDDDFGGFDDNEGDGGGGGGGFDEDGFGDDDEFGGFGAEEADVYVDAKFDETEDTATMTGVALFDFAGAEPEDLPFKKGDILKVKDIGDEDWYSGMNSEGREGIIPADYVEIKG